MNNRSRNNIIPLFSQPHLFGIVFLLILTVVVLLPATPVLYHTPDTDSSIFLLIGDKIRQGQLPYQDWYDHKPPLIFYLNALGLSLGNGSRWGVWFLELVSLLSAVLVGYSFLRRYYGSFISVAALAATLLNLTFVLQRGNMTEEYALPFQFATIFLLGEIDQGKKARWRLIAVGCMLAMASSLKQPLAGTGLSVVLYLIIRRVGPAQWRYLFLDIFWVGLGFVLVWLAWFVYFAAMGIFPEFWEAAFAYNFALSGIPFAKRFQALVKALSMLFEWSGFFLAAMLAWLVALPTLLLMDGRLSRVITTHFRFSQAENTQASWKTGLFLPLFIGVVDFPIAMIFTSLSGNNFAHYFMALLPSLTLLSAFLFYSILHMMRHASGNPLPYAWLMLFSIPILGPGLYDTVDRVGPRGDRQVEAIISYVVNHTQPGDYVLQWGIVPQVNLLSGRDAPSRYFFPDPLFVDGYSGLNQTSEFLQDLKSKPPILIIDEAIPRLPLLVPTGSARCQEVKDPRMYEQFIQEHKQEVEYDLPQMPAGMEEVYYWICQNYVPVGPVGELKWQVYRLKGR